MVNFYSGTDGRGYSIRLEVIQKSQNIQNNTSVVRMSLYLQSRLTYFTGATISYMIACDGKQLNRSKVYSMGGFNTEQHVDDFEVTINHNNDGTRNVKINASLNGSGGYSPEGCHLGSDKDFKLTTIARGSDFSPHANWYIGEGQTVNISRKNNAATHKITAKFGNNTVNVSNNAGSNFSFTPPTSWYSQIPNSTKGSVTFTLQTIIGGKTINTVTKNATVNIRYNNSLKPTIGSVWQKETNAKVSEILPANNYLQNVSKPEIGFANASAKQSASIRTYHWEQSDRSGSWSSSSSSSSAPVLAQRTSDTWIRLWVTDSRGYTSDKLTLNFKVVPYKSPALSFRAYRGGQGGNTDQILTTTSYSVSPIENFNDVDYNKNFATVRFTCRRLNGEDDVTIKAKDQSNFTSTERMSDSNKRSVFEESFSSFNSYEIIGTLSDRFKSVVYKAQVGPEGAVWSESKDSFAFGKVATGSQEVDSEWYYKYKGKDIQNYNLTKNNGQVGFWREGSDKTWTERKETWFGWRQNHLDPNGPLGSSSTASLWVQHYHLDNKKAVQIATSMTNRMFFRTSNVQNGDDYSFSDWNEIVTTSIPTMKNHNWTGIGNNTFYCARNGIVFLQVRDYVLSKNTTVSGKIPADFLKHITTPMEFSVSKKGVGGVGYNNIIVNPNGSVEFLRIHHDSTNSKIASTVSWPY